MQRTPNYNLLQYQTGDKFLKEDLNDSFSKIDIGLSDLQETVNNASGDATVTTNEVIAARKGEASLVDKINIIDSDLADITTYNVKKAGLIGNGVKRTITSVDSSITLSYVQSLNSSATLSSSYDWYVIQKYIKEKKIAYIPSGTYVIDTPLLVTDDVRIIGDSSKTSMLDFTLCSGNCIEITYTNIEKNISIENIYAFGSTTFSNMTNTFIRGVDLKQASFKDLVISGFNIGIDLDGNTNKPALYTNVYISDCNYGVKLVTVNTAYFKGLTIYHPKINAIFIDSCNCVAFEEFYIQQCGTVTFDGYGTDMIKIYDTPENNAAIGGPSTMIKFVKGVIGLSQEGCAFKLRPMDGLYVDDVLCVASFNNVTSLYNSQPTRASFMEFDTTSTQIWYDTVSVINCDIERMNKIFTFTGLNAYDTRVMQFSVKNTRFVNSLSIFNSTYMRFDSFIHENLFVGIGNSATTNDPNFGVTLYNLDFSKLIRNNFGFITTSQGSGWISGQYKPIYSNTATMTVNVDVTNGNDTTGDGSTTKPYATIQRAINSLPRNINLDVTIKVLNSAVTITLSSSLDLFGITGYGKITFDFTGCTVTGSLSYLMNTAYPGEILVSNCIINNTNSSGYVLYMTNGSSVEFSSCTFSSAHTVHFLLRHASVRFNSCTISANPFNIKLYLGSFVLNNGTSSVNYSFLNKEGTFIKDGVVQTI